MSRSSPSLAPLAALLVAVVVASTWGLGCRHRCETLTRDYRDTVAAARASTSSDDSRAHVGLGLEVDTLERVANAVVKRRLRQPIEPLDAIGLSRWADLRIELDPEATTLSIRPHPDSCRRCFDVGGTLRGRATLELPVGGAVRTELSARFDGTAPLEIESTDRGVRLALETGRLLRLQGRAWVANLEGLPPAVRSIAERAVASHLAETLASRLPTLPLYHVDSPRWQGRALDVEPVSLSTGSRRDRIFVLFRSDEIGAEAHGVDTMTEVLERARSKDVSWVVTPDWTRALVAERARASTETLRWHPTRLEWFESGHDLAVELDLRAWHLPDRGRCLRFDGTASGRIAARDGAIDVRLETLVFDETSGGGTALRIANRRARRRIREGERPLGTTLDLRRLTLPSGRVAFERLALHIDGELAVVTGDVRLLKERSTRDVCRDDRRRARGPGCRSARSREPIR